MNSPFDYMSDELHCESASLAAVARQYGTPLYVYSRNGMIEAVRRMKTAFAAMPNLICYALKANANPHLLRDLASEGSGADVVSGGELTLARRAGYPPGRIVFAGVGKTDDEIRAALESRILALNVESFEELQVVDQIAAELGEPAAVSVRINPDIDIKTHPYITTGHNETKFGIDPEAALEALLWAGSRDFLRPIGLHCHLGSMIGGTEPYTRSAVVLADLCRECQRRGIGLQHIDLGGGLGIDYRRVLETHGEPLLLRPEELAREVIPLVRDTASLLIIEPGRAVVGPHGVLLTRVLYVKQRGSRTFVVVDAAMNDLIRPALYQAHHEILPLVRRESGTIRADIVGPICESGDFFARERLIPQLQRGDALAIMTAGAYGYVLSSNYNSRPRAAEVLVDRDQTRIIREREELFV